MDHKNFSEGGKEVFETHFSGTLNLIKSINKDTLKGFIQIGSSDEYGANIAPQKRTKEKCLSLLIQLPKRQQPIFCKCYIEQRDFR